MAGAVAGALLGAALLSGCQSIAMDSPQLRVVEASPDAGVVDAYQNNAALAYNLGFGAVTSYVPMTPGSYALAADQAGTRKTLAGGSVVLSAGKHYTVIYANIAGAMQQTVLQDQRQPAAAGRVAMRFVQEATRSGPVDIYLVPKKGHGGLAGLAPLLTNLGFGANSGYLDVDAGTYALVVVPAGTALLSSTVTLLSGAQVEYAGGAERTVVLIDPEAGGGRPPAGRGVQALVLDDADE